MKSSWCFTYDIQNTVQFRFSGSISYVFLLVLQLLKNEYNIVTTTITNTSLPSQLFMCSKDVCCKIAKLPVILARVESQRWHVTRSPPGEHYSRGDIFRRRRPATAPTRARADARPPPPTRLAVPLVLEWIQHYSARLDAGCRQANARCPQILGKLYIDTTRHY